MENTTQPNLGTTTPKPIADITSTLKPDTVSTPTSTPLASPLQAASGLHQPPVTQPLAGAKSSAPFHTAAQSTSAATIPSAALKTHADGVSTDAQPSQPVSGRRPASNRQTFIVALTVFVMVVLAGLAIAIYMSKK